MRYISSELIVNKKGAQLTKWYAKVDDNVFTVSIQLMDGVILLLDV